MISCTLPCVSSLRESARRAGRMNGALVPICVGFETETCYLVAADDFGRTFCADLDLPVAPWVDAVAARIEG